MLDGIVGFILDALKQFVDWLVTWLCDLVSPMASWFIDTLPSLQNMAGYAATLAKYLYIANQWAPIGIMVSAMMAYWGALIIYFIVKVILYLF